MALDSLDAAPLSEAYALDPKFYQGDGSIALDLKAVFACQWQLVIDRQRLREAGGVWAADLAGTPVWLLQDGEHLRGVHDVCRHRAGPLEVVGDGSARRLRCRYHGWTYGPDGQLRNATEMQDAVNFDPAKNCLPQLAVKEWQGLVFAALQPMAGFDEVVADIDSRTSGVPIADFAYHNTVSYTLNCNWKIYIDNFLEGYHIPHIHPELNRILDYRGYAVELGEWYSVQHSPIDAVDGVYETGEALYYFLFPNTMLNILPDRMQTNRVLPLGHDRCEVVFDYYYRSGVDGEVAQDQAFSELIQQQDIDICEAVQYRLNSGSYRPGRLNPKRESGVHHFQQLLRRCYRFAQSGA